MQGMDGKTGKALTEIEHIQQSIRDVLSTPLGSRLMRRDYGSRLTDLIDHPLDDATLLEFYSATVDALNKWEPRIRVKSVSHLVTQGKVSLTLELEILRNSQSLTMEGIQIF